MVTTQRCLDVGSMIEYRQRSKTRTRGGMGDRISDAVSKTKAQVLYHILKLQGVDFFISTSLSTRCNGLLRR